MTNPIPTKLDDTDGDWLDLLCRRTGLKKSVVIRRAVRALAQAANRDPKWNWVGETAEPLPELPPELKKELEGSIPRATAERARLLAFAAAKKLEAAQALAAAAALEGEPKNFEQANARAKQRSEAGRRVAPRKTRS